MPAGDQHHAGDPGGLAGGRGAERLSGADRAAGGGAITRLIVRTDGAARGNPGPASLGAVLVDADQPGAEHPDAPPIATISEALGRQTNNVAEYTGLVRALALAAELGAVEVRLLLDSMLIVEQLAGRWRVKDQKLAPLHADAMRRLSGFRSWSARHVPRAQNRAADALANEALDRVARGGPPVVVWRADAGGPPAAGASVAAPAAGPAAPVPPAGPVQLEVGFDPGDAGSFATPLRVTIMGSGTSGGVPRIACPCATCTSADPRDRRSRASALLAWGEARAVIDVGPDFRNQALAAGLDRLDAVLLTHEHNDAVAGLDDLRRFNDLRGGYLPVYASAETFGIVVSRFAYAFEPGRTVFRGVPMLRPVTVAGPFDIEGRRFVPVPVVHFERPILGYRTGGFAYCSDVQRLEAPSRALLHGLDALVIEALRDEPHPGHQTVEEALALIAELRPRRAWLTHLDHDLRHADLAARLPDGVEVAYDGLVIDVPG